MTIAQLLELLPWPPGWSEAKKIERLWTYELPCKPEVLWPHIADSSRMNRALGLAEMTFEEREGKRFGASKPGGVRHAWFEQPWDWIANQWLTCVRIYERGFMKVMYAIHHLEPTDTGTRLYLYFGGVARGVFSGLAMKLGFPSIKKAYDRVLPAMAAQLDRLRPDALMLPPPVLSEEAETRLHQQRETLTKEGLPKACVDALLDWIRTGDDPDLHRIQIRERARVWKLPEEDLLKVALYATRAGLLTLSWDTICPHCRGVRDENASLSSLAAEMLTYTPEVLSSSRITSRPSFIVRVACSGETNGSSGKRITPLLRPIWAPLVPTRNRWPRAGPANTESPNLGPVDCAGGVDED